jgi:glycerophosphoryl diester phosphodiesterase
LIAAGPVRYAAMDGRLADLDSKDSAELVPWISDNWLLHFRWYGVGEFPAEERKKLHDIVAKAHEQKRLVRFWATPELTSLWRELQAAKVDFINTDDLEGLRDFLTKTPSGTGNASK